MNGDSTPRKLASGRSARWAFMERFEVPDYDGDGNYLTRWRVIQTPLAALYVHRFDGPDPRSTLHDHPWPFLSIVLRGGYVERRLDPTDMQVNENHRIRFVNRMRLGGAHAIVRLTRTPTWTLMLVGRRVRTWGYLEPSLFGDGGSWVWTEFNRHSHAYEFDAALARRKTRATTSPGTPSPTGGEG